MTTLQVDTGEPLLAFKESKSSGQPTGKGRAMTGIPNRLQSSLVELILLGSDSNAESTAPIVFMIKCLVPKMTNRLSAGR